MPARVINQDSAHQLGRDCEEVGAILPPHSLAVNQAKIRLVYKSGGLKGDAASFAQKIVAGHPMQLVIDDGRKFVEGALVSIAPGLEQHADVALRCRLQTAPSGGLAEIA
jgi:hypothetical protein